MIKALKSISLFWANLPYNVNWGIKMSKDIINYLKRNPLNIIDIGARGAELDELQQLKKYINYYGFDADREEALKLNQSDNKSFNSFNIYSYFIGKNKERIKFYLYKLIAQSSALKPNKRYQNNYGWGHFDIDHYIEVESITLDDWFLSTQIDCINLLKLDTQGTEYDILSNGTNSLKKTLMVQTEVEFIEMYNNQKLFFDVSKLMYDNGFEILYLNRVFHNRYAFYGQARGQLIWGDILFAKREDYLDSFSKEDLVLYVLTLINYGHTDFAYQIYQKHDLHNILDLTANFKTFRKSIFSKICRVIWFQFDKLLYYVLRLRKTNKNLYDSDRCYPIR